METIIKAGTLNLQGAWDTSPSWLDGCKLEEIARYMDQKKIEVHAFQ